MLELSKKIDDRLYELVQSSIKKNSSNLQDGKPIFWIRQHDLVNNLEKLASSLSNDLEFQLKHLTVEMIEEYNSIIDATGSRMQLAKRCEKLGLGNLIVDDAGSFNHYSTNKYKSKKLNNGIWIGNNVNGVVYVESDNGEITITTDTEKLTKRSLPSFLHELFDEKPIATHNHGAPSIRRSLWSGHPVMRVGDALIQLPAQTGFGFTSIFEQGLICSDSKVNTMKKKLDKFAERLWLGTVSQYAMKKYFSSLKN